jgi:hypothetical protein
MNGLAEVIPLASRRARRKPATDRAVPQPERTASVRKRRGLAFGLGLLGLVAALVMVDRAVMPRPPASVAPPLAAQVRSGLYQRTLADVVAACAIPEASAGFLRQHCMAQARFLLELPECTGDCSRLAAAIVTPR